MRICLLSILLLSGVMNAISQDLSRVSRLEYYDLETKTRTIVKEFSGKVEAPNWTPDGEYLVYNSNGLIYKLHWQGGEPEQINTGTIKTSNNDHVISADGKLLAISARESAGKSQVFTLPFTGGEPALVTPNAPSYLHGISPDNKYLSYTGMRDGEFDIYIIPLTGGQELRLTDSPGLDDGPEYSPDGKYIWFNSSRTGLMQVWRMKADGSRQKQMSFEESNNWFPHVSPDGKKIVYLSYRKEDVNPESHPADKNVEIRMMSAKGGKPETLISLFGGQGTINVNSWSPDSRKFAFVSYELVKP